MKKYTVQDCLNRAKSCIRQFEEQPESAVDLVFAAARVWLERAEYAHRMADGKISESDFVDVAETLYNLSNAPVKAIREAVGRLAGHDGTRKRKMTMTTTEPVKKFKRFRTLDEIRTECEKRGWKINTTKHDRDGHDHVRVDFKIKTLARPVIGHFLFNTFNGRFFGEARYGKDSSFAIDSSKTEHDHCLWFKILLESTYSNE